MKLRGAIPVLATPFRDNETIDEQDLRHKWISPSLRARPQFVFRVSAVSVTSFLIGNAIE
jgi:hypothetical protein